MLYVNVQDIGTKYTDHGCMVSRFKSIETISEEKQSHDCEHKFLEQALEKLGFTEVEYRRMHPMSYYGELVRKETEKLEYQGFAYKIEFEISFYRTARSINQFVVNSYLLRLRKINLLT